MNDSQPNELPVIDTKTAQFEWKWLLTILFGMFVIWTGILRNIEAQAFKPNALWFCLVMGLLAILGGFFYRVRKPRLGAVLAAISATIGLAFYFYCFIKQPEKDANYRVGLVILASIAELIVVALPKPDCCSK